MDLFSGFQWAVPKGFADALSLCRFEEGDILYDSHEAYSGKWKDSVKHINHHFVVKHPARSTTTKTENSMSVFNNNWGSEVRIDLYEKQSKVGIGQIRTTHGRLYTLLWKGDVSVIDSNNPEPKPPIMAREVSKKIGSIKKQALLYGSTVFAMVKDDTSAVLKNKYRKIYAKLKKHMPCKPVTVSAKGAGLKNCDLVAPTVEFVFFPVTGCSVEMVHDLIKDAVYIKAKNSKKEMFRLSAHGEIFCE